jgi:dolichyl-phosphate beta-glucosyltransferase
MGKVFTWISNTILGLQRSDFTCGFKVFERSAAQKLFGQQRISRWAFDSEMLFLAQLYGYRVAEVPVRWKNSPDTKVRIFKDTLVSFLSLFAIRINRVLGRYKR